MLIHTVKRGETLYSIANLYGVSPELLALNNDITGTLVVGDDLVILFPKQTHTVTQGETISIHIKTRKNFFIKSPFSCKLLYSDKSYLTIISIFAFFVKLFKANNKIFE